MNYDIIYGETLEEDENFTFMTIQDLINFCYLNGDKKILFVGTDYSVGDLGSWLGNYSFPAIEPSLECHFGSEIAKRLEKQLEEIHYAYKDGEYKYKKNEEFYVAKYGYSSEYKVLKEHSFYQMNEFQDTAILYTKIDPY